MVSLTSSPLYSPFSNNLSVPFKPPKPPKQLFYLLPPFTLRNRRFILHSKPPFGEAYPGIVSKSLDQQPPRTLFPGGYKRPEIKVPNLVLQLSSREVLDGKSSVLDVVNRAVAERVGIVVLTVGGESGGKLYEAGCLLKSIIKDRAYLLIDERVDIATAVNADGVVLSDEGLPAIVARDMMISSNPKSVVLPLVARTVSSRNTALDASKFEGADFLIYNVHEDVHLEEGETSIFEHAKVPTFILIGSTGSGKSFDNSYLLNSGASGLVLSLGQLELYLSADFNKLPLIEHDLNNRHSKEIQGPSEVGIFPTSNGVLGTSRLDELTKLDERVQQLVEAEKFYLSEAISVIKRAAPLMEEISLLGDAVSQLDDPFLLVIVVIVC